MLDTVVRHHSLSMSKLSSEVKSALSGLKRRTIISAPLQEKMRMLKNRLSSLSARILAHRRALEDILEEEVEMALMNLTHLHQNPQLYKYFGYFIVFS